jgi:DNA-directed RNA polymerase specialized sigma24 family protein
MTKEELKRLPDLEAEIKDIQKELERLERYPETADKVRSSGNDFPYINGHTTVHGYAGAAVQGDKARYQFALERLKAKADKQRADILEYIETIDDARVRQMIRYRYVKGYTTEKVGRIMHCDRTSVEKTIKRYLETSR